MMFGHCGDPIFDEFNDKEKKKFTKNMIENDIDLRSFSIEIDAKFFFFFYKK